MALSAWFRLLCGSLIGLAGLLILARLDVPLIQRGGWAGFLAGADLSFFTLLLVSALTLATTAGDADDGS
jgi:hypothetical protein